MDHPGSTLVAPGVYLVDLPPGGGNVYVWEASHGLTLIDTGVPGSAPAVPFNIDRPDVVAAVRKQARLDYDTACVDHGQPLIGGAGRKAWR